MYSVYLVENYKLKYIIMEQVTLNQIDTDAYVLKNKLMHRFDEHYGTHLAEKDADDLSFLDIIMAPDCSDALDLYAEIKTIANHGVTDEQKNFLYKIFPFFSNSNADQDFDCLIGRLEKMIERTGREKKIAGAKMVVLDDYENDALAVYHRKPLSILRMQRVGDERMEAMLVQNQCILILEIRTSNEELDCIDKADGI